VKIVYDAEHSLDAHVVRNLLESESIPAFIQGEYLQGGVGELAASGFVKVSVHDADAARARTIIRAWEAAQPADEELEDEAYDDAPADDRQVFQAFLAGFVAGAFCMWLYLHAR
jgi:hypothetical protein